MYTERLCMDTMDGSPAGSPQLVPLGLFSSQFPLVSSGSTALIVPLQKASAAAPAIGAVSIHL